MRRLGQASAMVLALAWAGAAGATGSLDCAIADRTLALEAGAAVSYSIGGFNNFHAALTIKVKDVPADLARLDLGPDDLMHHWFSGGELKLELYREREGSPHGTVRLVVDTKRVPGSDGAYRGSYVLTLYTVPPDDGEGRSRTFKGKAACSVE